MKNLKTFESFSTNEGMKDIFNKGKKAVKKFFKGHESKEDFNKAEKAFMKELSDAEAKVKKDEDSFSFDKKGLQEQAKENDYLGKLDMRKGGRNKKITYVVYDKGTTDFKRLASDASGVRR
jgi:vacuolar-type H+-ATPase subunit I/STV1